MKKLFIMLAMASLMLAGCSSASNDGAKKITVALLPNESTEDGTRQTEMLIEEFQKALGDSYEVEAMFCDEYSAVQEAILTGTAQIAWESGATFTATRLEDDAVIAMFTYGADGKLDNASYPAYLVTSVENKADFEGKTREEQLSQLKGHTFSFVSATSTSGRLVPTTSLWLHFGPEGTGDVTSKSQIFEMNESEGGLFSEVQFGGSHPANAQLIAENKVYAGAFCCSYGDDYADDLYFIDEVAVPNGPMWCNSDYLSEEEINTITEHFINLTPENAVEGFFAPETGYFSDEPENRFVKQPDDFYDFLIAMYQD